MADSYGPSDYTLTGAISGCMTLYHKISGDASVTNSDAFFGGHYAAGYAGGVALVSASPVVVLAEKARIAALSHADAADEFKRLWSPFATAEKTKKGSAATAGAIPWGTLLALILKLLGLFGQP